MRSMNSSKSITCEEESCQGGRREKEEETSRREEGEIKEERG